MDPETAGIEVRHAASARRVPATQAIRCPTCGTSERDLMVVAVTGRPGDKGAVTAPSCRRIDRPDARGPRRRAPRRSGERGGPAVRPPPADPIGSPRRRPAPVPPGRRPSPRGRGGRWSGRRRRRRRPARGHRAGRGRRRSGPGSRRRPTARGGGAPGGAIGRRPRTARRHRPRGQGGGASRPTRPRSGAALCQHRGVDRDLAWVVDAAGTLDLGGLLGGQAKAECPAV